MSEDLPISGRIAVKFRRWGAPGFAAIAGDGRAEPKAEGVPVMDLDVATLDALASAWLEDLYKKAGKKSPWSAQRQRGPE